MPPAALTAPVPPSASDAAALPPTLLALLQRAAGAGAWVLSLPGQQLSWTQPLADLLHGGGEAAPLWQQPLDFFAPESRDHMAAVLLACATQGTAFDEEAQAINAQGQRLWVRALGEAVHDASGALVQISGVIKSLSTEKRAQQETLSLTMRLATTLASMTDAFATLDREARLTYVNPEAERLLRRPSTDLLGQPLWEVLEGSDAERLHQDLLSALGSAQYLEREAFYAAQGRWLELRVHPFDEGLALYLRDVSDRRHSQEQLLLLQTSISRLNDIVLITEAGPVDAPGPRIVFVNDAFERQTGYSRAEVLGQTPRLLQGQRTQRAELDRIRQALSQAQPVRAELINYKKNGEQFWLELEIVPVDYFSRGLTHWVAVARDITERKAAEDEIEHLAFYDALTQLPNRQLLMNSLRLALSHTENPDKTGALMFIDLDNFKVLNDTRGHATGDLLLQKVASRLNACVRLRDTVARLGGDEFVVLLEDLGDDAQVAAAKAKQIGRAHV